MKPGFVDSAVAIYVLWGLRRGWREGFPRELPRLVGAAAAIFTGSGLVLHAAHLLALAGQTTGSTLGFLSAPGLVVVSLLLVRRFRTRLAACAERFCPERRRRLSGAGAGALRGLALAGFVVVSAGLSGFGPVHRAFAERSVFGRTLFSTAVPAWESLTGKPLRPSADSARARTSAGDK
ncbi:MAG: CvpA family protein [Verrucomicrobiae bacterium]|nr:CvpA family protein [Verrucomicrobiae bacterium]